GGAAPTSLGSMSGIVASIIACQQLVIKREKPVVVGDIVRGIVRVVKLPKGTVLHTIGVRNGRHGQLQEQPTRGKGGDSETTTLGGTAGWGSPHRAGRLRHAGAQWGAAGHCYPNNRQCLPSGGLGAKQLLSAYLHT